MTYSRRTMLEIELRTARARLLNAEGEHKKAAMLIEIQRGRIETLKRQIEEA